MNKIEGFFFLFIYHLKFCIVKTRSNVGFCVMFQEKLGEIVYVELPEVDAEFEKEGGYKVFEVG